MSQDVFNQRIARINGQSGRARTRMAGGDGMATPVFSSPVAGGTLSMRRHVKPGLMGAVLGLIVGTIAAGLENPQMPWGPAFAYNDLVVMLAVLALCAGPVMAIAGCAMRNRSPAFFFFAAAYFPCAIGAALLDLPVF
jgi:hypothetical protein